MTDKNSVSEIACLYLQVSYYLLTLTIHRKKKVLGSLFSHNIIGECLVLYRMFIVPLPRNHEVKTVEAGIRAPKINYKVKVPKP